MRQCLGDNLIYIVYVVTQFSQVPVGLACMVADCDIVMLFDGDELDEL